MKNFDVIVIGAGPGGYVAAIRCAQLGLKTCVIEANHLGGICLNWGCIPTKALLKSAEVYRLIKNAKDFGITIGNSSINFDKIIERSRNVSSQLANGIKHLLKKNKVTVINGYAKFKEAKVLEVTENGKIVDTVQGKNIIIATGAKPRIIPGFEPDNNFIWTYKEAMVPDNMPKSILVVGSGAIGVEFASFYNSLGVDVTLLEVADRILINEDKEIADLAHKSFEKQGIKIITKASLKSNKKNKKDITVTYEHNGKTQDITVERVIMSVGVVANTDALGLENTKVKLDKGHIVTDAYTETDEKNIYAIGDVAAAPFLAHKASHEAIIAAEKIAGKSPHNMVRTNIPGCTYSYPQVASVGITEENAKNLGYNIKVGRFPFIANGKAVASGSPEGLVKTIFDAATGELLGAHMIGDEVTELIQGYVVAKTMEATEEDIINTVFPHPTLSEMMHESVLDAFDRVIHF